MTKMFYVCVLLLFVSCENALDLRNSQSENMIVDMPIIQSHKKDTIVKYDKKNMVKELEIKDTGQVSKVIKYNNGIRHMEVNYKNGLQHGTYLVYGDNGVDTAIEAKMENGQRFFFKKHLGNLILEQYYNNGKVYLELAVFYRDGEKIIDTLLQK